jgi:hypothetical protein
VRDWVTAPGAQTRTIDRRLRHAAVLPHQDSCREEADRHAVAPVAERKEMPRVSTMRTDIPEAVRRRRREPIDDALSTTVSIPASANARRGAPRHPAANDDDFGRGVERQRGKRSPRAIGRKPAGNAQPQRVMDRERPGRGLAFGSSKRRARALWHLSTVAPLREDFIDD